MTLKFIYSEKTTQFCEIFPLLLSYGVPVKSKGKISQNFVAFSEYMNFKGPFKYYVSQEVGEWSQKIAVFAELQCYLCWRRWVDGPKKCLNGP